MKLKIEFAILDQLRESVMPGEGNMGGSDSGRGGGSVRRMEMGRRGIGIVSSGSS